MGISNQRRFWPRLAIWILGLALLVATLLPFVESNEWWIRVLGFPRPQFAALLGVVLVVAVLVLERSRPATWLFLTSLLLALGYQVYRIVYFTPLVPVQAMGSEACEERSTVRLLIANVLDSNRRSRPLLDMIREVDADVLHLVETDEWWDDELAVLESSYPFVVRQPQDNTYGMHLLSRLELIEPEVRFLLEEDVPSIKIGLRLRSGAAINFHGLHPKPPRPSVDTDERDAELLIVGDEVAAEDEPAIVAGDLNDVAWSQTNKLFQEISGLLDPRIGRGIYATYNANWLLLRWPLDHIFFEESFTVLTLRRMGDIGSDHFPVFIALCHRPEAAAEQSEPEAGPEARGEMREGIEEGREESQEPD